MTQITAASNASSLGCSFCAGGLNTVQYHRGCGRRVCRMNYTFVPFKMSTQWSTTVKHAGKEFSSHCKSPEAQLTERPLCCNRSSVFPVLNNAPLGVTAFGHKITCPAIEALLDDCRDPMPQQPLWRALPFFVGSPLPVSLPLSPLNCIFQCCPLSPPPSFPAALYKGPPLALPPTAPPSP